MEAHSGLPLAAIVNFVFLVLGGIFFLRKNVASGLGERHDSLKLKIAEAESLRVNAENLFNDYDQKLKRLDQEVQVIYQEAKVAAEKEKVAILARAEASAAKIIDQAKTASAQHLLALEKNIRGDLSALAIEEARKQLAAKASLENHEAFFDSFFTQAKVTHG